MPHGQAGRSRQCTADIDDAGLRAAAKAGAGRITLPTGLPFLTPADGNNVAFLSQWDHQPKTIEIPLTGHATRAHFLLAGSTTNMQSRIDNGELVVRYSDGSTTRLPLHNPTTWWPIEQDYFVDDHAFAIDSPLPARLDLKTLRLRHTIKGTGGRIPGGSATLLELTLDPSKELRSLTARSLSNESVIGLLAVTLERGRNPTPGP